MSFSGSDSWTILSPIEQSIKRKIETVGVPLRDWDVSINYGIKTGLNEAFIIDGAKKDELIAADPKSAEIIRPILRGRDIRRYNCSYADLWLLFVPWHFPLHMDESICGASEKAESAFAKQYPAVYKHLLQYKSKLQSRNRAETGIRYEWYALQRWGAKYWDDFSRQKIVYREISDAMDACMVDAGVIINNKCYMITGEHLTYLISFINSKLFTKIILQQANTTGGKGESFLKKIRSPIPSKATEAQLDGLLSERKNTTAQQQQKIDKETDTIICKLFGLSDDEIQYVLD